MAPINEDIIPFEDPNYSNPEVVSQAPFKHRRSPIIATLGDPNISHVDIQKMMEVGVNAITLKTSNFTKGEKLRMVGKVDKAATFLCQKHAILDWPCATCVELKSCIVTTGIIEGDDLFINLEEGNEVVLVYSLDEMDKCNRTRIFVDNPYIAVDVKVGMMISIAQDEIVLECQEIIDDKSIKCKVTRGGKFVSLSTVCVRGGTKSHPYLTKKDLSMVKFAMQYQIDMILINYARHPTTIRKVKQYMGRKYKRPMIISGICNEEGLKNVDDIIKESDGIVFSREYLTYELEESARYRLLLIQKWVGAKCQQAGKPFFISGDIFREALSTGKFLDNECAEVSNAMLDGATGFILNDCSNTELVLEVVNAINRLCCHIEPFTNWKTDFWRVLEGMPMPVTAAEATALSCAALANVSGARAIIIPTVTGYTAKILMWLRPVCLILTVSTHNNATRRLMTCRSVVPLMYKGGDQKKWHSAMNARVRFAVEYAVKMGWLEYGDSYVTLQRGTENSAFCDTVRAWKVKIHKKLLVECDEDQEAEKLNTK